MQVGEPRGRFQVLGHVIALAAGGVLAFFVVFAALFADPGGLGERVFSLLLVLVTYGAVGAGLGFAWPRIGWVWGAWTAAPALALVAWYTTREPQRWPLHLLYLALAFGAAAAGALLGARVRMRSQARRRGGRAEG